MRRARVVLVLTTVLSLAMVVLGTEESETKEGEEGQDASTVVCATNPCFGVGRSDTILGTDGPEQIHALRGSDEVSAFGGRDVLAGDEDLQEDRFLSSRPGSATLADGDDRLDAGPGDDGPVKGYGGSDVLLGGEGNDSLDAREFSQRLGSDFVDGGPGEDSITAKDGAFDNIACGAGEDTVSGFDEGLDFVSSDCEHAFSVGQ